MTDAELNEAVARKMGWKPHINKKRNWGVWKKKGYEDIPYQLLPNYCEEIAAAWEIVEKHKDIDNNEFALIFHWIRPGLWTAGWGSNTEDGFTFAIYAEADTAPRAICQSFLKLP